MDLISKKELLAITGISYGQLYRWKRERLLPEEWFMKQSSYTGQETFFPKDQVLSRIKAILDLKDDHSLEEVSKLLATDPDALITRERLSGLSHTDGAIADTLAEVLEKETFTVGETAIASAIQENGMRLGVADSAIPALIRSAIQAMRGHPVHDALCTILAEGDGFHVCVTEGPVHPTFDEALETRGIISIGEAMNALRVRLEADKKGINPEEV